MSDPMTRPSPKAREIAPLYLPPGIAPDLAADQWRQKPESLVKREEPGPNAEAWLRKWVPIYRGMRERLERMAAEKEPTP